ncbi:MAG: T9SS type A sorting domain-containing protein [Chitinophagales bacterium]
MSNIFRFLTASLIIFSVTALNLNAQQQINVQKLAYQGGTSSSGQYANSFEFSATLPSSWNSQHIPKRNNSLLWVFGDGTFDFANLGETVVHTYHRNATHQPYLLVTRIKDDKEDPFSVFWTNTTNIDFTKLGILNASRPNNPVNMDNAALRLIANRNPRPQDDVTYVLSYENTCPNPVSSTIVFEFDNTIFDVNSNSVQPYYLDETTSIPPITSMNRIEVDFNIPSNEQRSIFITLQTKSEARIGNPVECKTFLKFTDTDLCATNNAPVSLQQKVVLSHDPNFKQIQDQSICVDSPFNTQMREYYIEFQNIGAGPASEVVVIDQLHTYLDIDWNTVNFDATPFFTKFPSNLSNFPSPNGLGIVKWDFKGLTLRGMQEPGYGTDFHPDDTKGWIKFYAHPKINAELPACGAIPNRAEIIFDCNSPIYTNNALSTISCFMCSDCSEKLIFLDTITVAGGEVPIGNEVSSKIGFDPSFQYEWYPSHLIDNPKIPDPFLFPNQTTDFTLVVSSPSCQRYIFQKRVVVAKCNSSLKITATATQKCKPSETGDISAQVVGGFTPYTWNSCETTSAINLNNLSAGSYYLQVTDANGCSADTLIHIEAPLPLWVDIDIDNCTAYALVSGGFGSSLSYQWSNLSTNSNISVAPSSSYFVTVTDAKGCTFVQSFSTDASCNIVGIETLSPFDHSDLVLYPNPTSKSAQLQFAVNKAGEYQVQVFDLYGRIYTHKDYALQSGKHELSLDLQNIAGGCYFVVVNHQQFHQTAKLMVVK